MAERTVRIDAFRQRCTYEVPTTPKEFMEFWQKKLEQVPKEYLDSTSIELEVEEEYGSAYLEVRVSYTRLENSDEKAKRLKTEKDRREFSENRELCELERLRNKYKV